MDIQRIKEMEERLNRVLAWLKDGTGDAEEDVRALEEYYRSSLWLEDFEADEAGEFPADLPRGVLSEDGIDHALEEYAQRRRNKTVSESDDWERKDLGE